MPSKLKTARICILVESWLAVIFAVIFLLIFGLSGSLVGMTNQEGAVAGGLALGVVGIVVAISSGAFGVLGFFTAKGITNKQEWARIVGIVLGVLNIPGFPIGTLLGVLILVGLLGDEATDWFHPVQEQ